MNRYTVAIALIYGISVGAASIGINMMFGLGAQLLSIPLFFLGAVVLGKTL